MQARPARARHVCPRVVIALVETPAPARTASRRPRQRSAAHTPLRLTSRWRPQLRAPVERQSAGGPEPHLLQIEDEAAVTAEGAGAMRSRRPADASPNSRRSRVLPRLRVTKLECHLEEPRALIARAAFGDGSQNMPRSPVFSADLWIERRPASAPEAFVVEIHQKVADRASLAELLQKQ